MGMSELTLAPPLRISTGIDEAAARRTLRAQIAKLERELAELFTRAYPRKGFDWSVASRSGPRLLGLQELEELRDDLAGRVEDVRHELRGRNQVEQANIRLIDRMVADPASYRWVQVSADDVGARGCKYWHSLPKLGIVGMLMGWWRVKISSGCP